jgi:hypothetical protein
VIGRGYARQRSGLSSVQRITSADVRPRRRVELELRDRAGRHVDDASRQAAGEVAELGVVAAQHQAHDVLVGVADHGEQIVHSRCVQRIVDDDAGTRVAELGGDQLRRRQRARSGAADDQVGLRAVPCQALARLRRVVEAAFGQRALAVVQRRIVAAGLGMPHEVQDSHRTALAARQHAARHEAMIGVRCTARSAPTANAPTGFTPCAAGRSSPSA